MDIKSEKLDPDDERVCGYHPLYTEAIKVPGDENPEIIQNELQFGTEVRLDRRKKLIAKGIPPKKSPYWMPFDLCRAKQKPCIPKKTRPKKLRPVSNKVTLLEKSCFSQEEYCKYLATPAKKCDIPCTKKHKKIKCDMDPCPPVFVQLAVPHKRRVYYTWKCHYPIMTTSAILRLEQILHTDKNLEPRDARYYYKKLDKIKRKELRKKRRYCRQKLKEVQQGDEDWLEQQIRDTAKAIVDFLRDEPLFSLNYKQLLLSDAILTKCDEKKVLIKPPRNTRNRYKRTQIEISDKVAVWMDTITKFVDMQAVEDDDDIRPVTISSISGEEEGESELGEASIFEGGLDEEEGEGEMDMILDMIDDWGDLDELIRIYRERTPDDYMQSTVIPMPWIRYIDILEAMIWLRDEIKANGPPPPPGLLETAMINWLSRIAPHKLNEQTLKAIHEFACCIADKLRKQGFQITEEPTYVDEIGEEEKYDVDVGLDKDEGGKGGEEEAAYEYQVEEEGGEYGGEEEEDLGPLGPIILHHKPSFITEHSPDAICCLSLKIWAVWLLEVTHNAHTWTKWMHEVIRQIRVYASIVRGDVRLPTGERKVLYKEEWRRFIKETEDKIIYWLDYSGHVKELSDSIIKNFHGKPVYCCPKCLQDHLIKDVVTAHETLKALTDAMNMAQYWRKCLDSLVATTAALTDIEELSSSSSSDLSTVDIEEIDMRPPCPGAPQGPAGGDSDSSDEGSWVQITQMDPRIQKPDCNCR